MRNTTCHNFECPQIETCMFNIWRAHENPAPCMGKDKPGFGDYLSAKQSIYKDYVKKAKERGEEKPMNSTEYFEEW